MLVPLAARPAGAVPKLMVMDSPSSLSVSSVAVTVNVLEVSVVLTVTSLSRGHRRVVC